MLDRSLWEKSGHWEKFAEAMFTTSSENRDYAVKPMNCPAHVQIFNQGLKSYRDLPLRMSEFGLVHRNEVSGTLHGLMRARRFTQDDAHIFCTEGQLQAEVKNLIDLTFTTYRDFGFDDVAIAISTRPERRVGTEQQWDKAEEALQVAARDKGLQWKLQPGEGAFYGPKIDFVLKDCIGRSWQCGTIQVDFSMPGRLDATYIAEDSSKQTPVMIHRAILGSIERFIGILIEHYAGSFPTWLSPDHVIVLSLTEKHVDATVKVAESLRIQGFRATSDLRNETIGLKIREHAMRHVPYLLIIGAREMENNTVAVRTRNGEDLGGMPLGSFIDRLRGDIANRGRTILED
jgi:threonyl-tRNA synthetase